MEQNCPSGHEVLFGGDVCDGDDVLLQLDLAVLLGSSVPWHRQSRDNGNFPVLQDFTLENIYFDLLVI